MTTINKKINHIFSLLEKLVNGEEIYAQSQKIQTELGVNERTLRRYLNDIYELYSHIVTTQKNSKEFSERKVTIYRLLDKKKDISSVFKFFLDKSDDLSWLLQLVHENDPSLLRDYESENKGSLESVIKGDQDIFLFVGSPFEKMDDERFKTSFLKLKNAVKNHEYRDIIYNYNTLEKIINVKCLKLVHMNNNWYIAIETSDNQFRFLRVAFIESIEYSKEKISYQSSSKEKYIDLFASIQNAMTINEPFKEAKLRASAQIAIYFRDKMKPFFPSQKFLQENEDGSIDFTIKFTHYIEILPFIKQWQPDITVISPIELEQELIHDLNRSLENYNGE